MLFSGRYLAIETMSMQELFGLTFPTITLTLACQDEKNPAWRTKLTPLSQTALENKDLAALCLPFLNMFYSISERQMPRKLSFSNTTSMNV